MRRTLTNRFARRKRKTAEATFKAVTGRLKGLPKKAGRTLTLDNGTENTKHEAIKFAIGFKCFFTHPYASWERGTSENVNGLVRWYLPKGTDFRKISYDEIAHIEYLIDNRPRKCLGLKKPIEVAVSFVALRG
jgi:IS30 family transposase